jgi:hypothetical protein
MSASELVVHALRELVDALDRRAARVERLGETHIARESAALRKEAVNRIHELTAVLSDRDTPEGDAPGENSAPIWPKQTDCTSRTDTANRLDEGREPFKSERQKAS